MTSSPSPRAAGGVAPQPPEAFRGFSDAALAFYEGLEADNSKAYFTDHATTFEAEVRAPLRALTAALAEEFGQATLFRPYRDVRFSADKSPYKTSQGAVIGMGQGTGALYVQISAAGLLAGGGFYRMAPDQLTRYRRSVADAATGERLVAVTDALCGAGFDLSGRTLTRAPRGISPDHPRIELLRHTALAATREFGAPRWLATPAALDHVAQVWREVAPLNQWLAAEVGPSR